MTRRKPPPPEPEPDFVEVIVSANLMYHANTNLMWDRRGYHCYGTH